MSHQHMSAASPVRVLDKESFFAEGERLDRKVQARLERQPKGKIIAIEVESGQYIVGEDEVVVAKETLARFPGKVFSFFRIGYPVVHNSLGWQEAEIFSDLELHAVNLGQEAGHGGPVIDRIGLRLTQMRHLVLKPGDAFQGRLDSRRNRETVLQIS